MKIAFFSDSFYPELGGIPDSITATGKKLAEFDNEVRFYASRYSKKDYERAGMESEPYFGPRTEIVRLPSLPFPSSTGQERMALPTGLGWNSLRKWKPDIIHTNNIFGLGLEALFSAKLLNRPLIGTNHSVLREYLRYGPLHSNWSGALTLKYNAWYYNKCDFVSAPSNSAFGELLEFGLYKPHEAISNPVDTNIFRPLSGDKKGLKARFGLSENSLVWAGRIAAEKNNDVIIKAVSLARKEIPDITLAIAGRGSEENKLKKLSQELGVEDNIIFLGTLEKPVLADLYRASEIFCIASTSETQSMVLLQAMACGLPAVGVDSLALPEYIEDSKTGLIVPPGDPATFAGAIKTLLKNPGQMEIMGKNAARSASRFSILNIAEKWESVYSGAIEKHRK